MDLDVDASLDLLAAVDVPVDGRVLALVVEAQFIPATV
jgi:hypothetical protein